MNLDDDEPLHRHGYSVAMHWLFLRLVLAGTSLRGASRVLAVLAEALDWGGPVPHWTTGRLWLLRLGHAMLTAPQKPASDWAWLIDHSVQIGQDKCLVILGIRLPDLPPPGQSLTHADLQLIALVPRKSWTRRDVDDALEAATAKAGVPRVLVTDHGVDLHGGVTYFRERHPQTQEIYDAKHKAACVLKRRLGTNPRWQEFPKQLGPTRCAIQQTELAFLVPPAPKPKSRFLNLDATLQWAGKVVALVEQPPPCVGERVSPERLQEKLGWLTGFAADIAEWREWPQIVNGVVAFVNHQGIARGAAGRLRAELPQPVQHPSSGALVNELVGFVAQQARRTQAGERFPGSTEVLESCFGRFKQLEKQQSRGGFTSLLLGFGALLATTPTAAIETAMNHRATYDVYEWCRNNLGLTVFGQRKQAFAACATKPG